MESSAEQIARSPHPLIRIPAGIMLLSGFWLAISPWFMPGPYPVAAQWVDCSDGIVLMILGAIKLLFPLFKLPEWSAIIIGLWVLFSPWIMGFSYLPGGVWATYPVTNTVLSITVAIAGAAWALVATVTVTGI